MAEIRPFSCVRPAAELADRVAALPYDVYNRQEAKAEVQREPMSFLKIDRAETSFDDSVDTYAPEVYEKARELLEKDIEDGVYITDPDRVYYIYQLEMDGRTQTGLVACSSVDDYMNQVIKKHENTRADKEVDRITHVDTCSAQTGPIFLAYRADQEISQVVDKYVKTEPVYDFTAVDGISHRVWKIDGREDVDTIYQAFQRIDKIYIADGHHRAASAVKVALKRRKETPGYDGTEEFNYFLSVLFPAEELRIFDYNRVVRAQDGISLEKILEGIGKNFYIEETDSVFRPGRKGEIGMYGGGKWYRLTAHEDLYTGEPVEDLDVSVLQNYILEPLLGIKNPKAEPRLTFVGGIRGLEELVRLVDEAALNRTPLKREEKVAFAMYPTSMEELLAVADAGGLMPPKSTWFEPKLRSGLFIHMIEANSESAATNM